MEYVQTNDTLKDALTNDYYWQLYAKTPARKVTKSNCLDPQYVGQILNLKMICIFLVYELLELLMKLKRGWKRIIFLMKIYLHPWWRIGIENKDDPEYIQLMNKYKRKNTRHQHRKLQQYRYLKILI